MKNKKKILIGGTIALILLLTVLSKTGVLKPKVHKTKVETAKVERRDITETVLGSGTVQPEKEVKISSEVSGEIIELPVKEGQQVKQGDLLVRINPDIYQSAYARAVATMENARSRLQQQKAQLDLAKSEYLRSKQLFEKGIIARADYLKAKTNYETALAAYQSGQFQVKSARAGVKEAADNLKRTEIYAPMTGTVTRLNVEKGERVVGTKQMSGTELLRIADLNRMEVLTDINENDIVKVHRGDTAWVEIEAFPGRKFSGIVTEIANSAENTLPNASQTVNFKVKVRILKDSYRDLIPENNPDLSPFRPGMTAGVEIVTHKKTDILTVPIAAVTIREDSTGTEHETVFLFDNGTAKQRFVKTGIQDEQYIEIKEGLKEGDEVISGPFRVVSKELKDGMAVEKKSGNPHS